MANQVPNSFKVMLWKGQIEGLTDTFKMILLQSGFVFDQTSHQCYADVIAYEVAHGNGYLTGGATLTGISITQNDTSDLAEVTWNNVQWDATGGSISASGAIIYNDSTDAGGTDDHTDAIVSYKDAGGTITATVGTPIIISSIKETIGDLT